LGLVRGADVVFSVRVQAILASRSDGGDAPTVTAEDIRQALRLATDVFKAADVEFLFDPASDVVTMPSDLLSRDCTLPPGVDLNGQRSIPPFCDTEPNAAEHTHVDVRFRGNELL
jgi:hypothetical protein